MIFRRRFSRRSPSSRDYADKLADAMGEGLGGDDARAYAGGSMPLRLMAGRPATPDTASREPMLFDDADMRGGRLQ